MKDFLTYLVQNLVDNPDEVSVEEINEPGLVSLQIKVAQADMGKVIGKEGRIIKAIRDLVHVLAAKNNLRVNVVLSE